MSILAFAELRASGDKVGFEFGDGLSLVPVASLEVSDVALVIVLDIGQTFVEYGLGSRPLSPDGDDDRPTNREDETHQPHQYTDQEIGVCERRVHVSGP